jgi:putative peptidoglycan lipid II flippase
MLNLGLIAAGFLIAPASDAQPIVGMAFGALLGGLGQLLIQVPWMKAQGFRPTSTSVIPTCSGW